MTYKVFESGETLTANDVMTYFMNQVVVQVDTEAELADLLADHADVRVAYAQDTDKVYAVVAGNWQELAYEGGDFTFDDLTVNGNLTVNGTTTNINSTNLVVEDKNIIIADVATPTDTTADGAGITIKGSTDKTFNWVDSTDAFTASEHINLASGKEYKVNGTTVLSSSQVLGKALPTGDVVGHTDSQTLTNKTISGASNTLSNIPNNALTNSSITISGTQVALGGTYTLPSGYTLPSQTGNSGKFLTTDGTTDSWGTVDLTTKTDKATLTTTGDIYYASSASTPARLGIGTTGQVLTVVSGLPSWATPAGGSSTFSGCSLYGTDPGNFEISAGASTLITWNQELFDVGGYHSTSTNTDRITIPSGKAGYYLINAAIEWDDDNAVATCGIRVYLNGTEIARRYFLRSDNGGRTATDVQVTRNLAVNDYLQVYAYTETAQGAYHYSPQARFEVVFVGNA